MKKKMSFLLSVCVIVSLLVGCSNGKSYEQMIVGEWYSEYSGSNFSTTWHFSFLEDGAYKELPSDKAGTWNIVDQNNTKQLKLTDAWQDFDLYEIVYIDDNTLTLKSEKGEVKTFKRSKEEYSTYKQMEEYKQKNSNTEKNDEEIMKEIDAINQLSQEADILCDNLTTLALSVGFGEINKGTPKDELGNLDITKLPNAGANFQECREFANNLTIKDVIDYKMLNISEDDLSKLAYTRVRSGGWRKIVYQDYINSDEYVVNETIYDLKYSTRISDLLGNGDETVSTQSQSIVGKWQSEELPDHIYIFNADGTGQYDIAGNVLELTYKAEDGTITITFLAHGYTPITLKYELDGDKLNIQDSFGSDTVYLRVKE